ncbi:S16 family serine protease [Hyperthermus butylicus]|uniref:Archaeal serine protease n=1 Tax=Hyperthermus butylicus (strain DSM 5456 / JCM 9403 / PLM1-5) TaxID=415426 RepID=A2BJS9_HYPBU|nr:S16 family serine protease [Hyperthermus butylicus]ABM80240.1 Archaeal serine protease [Hyperthermus butylicus DSM 5456]
MRVYLAAMVLAFLAASLALPVAAGAVGGSSGYVWMRSVHVIVPAVAMVDGRYVGVLSELIVTVAWPGNGTVYFAADPLTELDTQAAARMAVLVASMLAGVDYHSYDYFIHLRAESPIVGGPSASGAMAVAVLAALRGKSIPSNFSMTGMVDPDATLGPVGGIPQKLEAVAEKGVKLFVIPASQAFAHDLNTGGLVDVRALGEQLGVKVEPTLTILDAYVAATGDRELAKDTVWVWSLSYPGWLAESLNDTAARFAALAGGNLTCWNSLARGLAGLPPSLISDLEAVAGEAARLLALSRQYLGNGSYYSAASAAFRAAISATYACLAGKALASRNLVGELVNDAERLVNASLTLLGEANQTVVSSVNGNLTDVALQIAITAYSRLQDAYDTVERAQQYVRAVAVADRYTAPVYALKALYYSVYGYYRALTALQWAKLISEARSYGSPVTVEKLTEAIHTYLYFARSGAEYLETLGVDTSELMQTISQAYAVLEEANTVLDMLHALSLTVRSLADLAALLHSAFSVSVENAVAAAEVSLNQLLALVLRRQGVTPLIPLMYREYAGTLADMQAKLALYVEAASYTILLSTLAAKPAAPPEQGAQQPANATCSCNCTYPATVQSSQPVVAGGAENTANTSTTIAGTQQEATTTANATGTGVAVAGGGVPLVPALNMVLVALVFLALGIALGVVASRV